MEDYVRKIIEDNREARAKASGLVSRLADSLTSGEGNPADVLEDIERANSELLRKEGQVGTGSGDDSEREPGSSDNGTGQES